MRHSKIRYFISEQRRDDFVKKMKRSGCVYMTGHTETKIMSPRSIQDIEHDDYEPDDYRLFRDLYTAQQVL